MLSNPSFIDLGKLGRDEAPVDTATLLSAQNSTFSVMAGDMYVEANDLSN